MRRSGAPRVLTTIFVSAVTMGLAGCGVLPRQSVPAEQAEPRQTASGSERECLVRAMYFESNRSSEDGLLAVGTVVMNRVASPAYPDTLCEVVGQPGQFAAGIMRKPMTEASLSSVERVADQVLAGKRHRGVGEAMSFHTAGLRFPYRNMHYVAVAGGNAFYVKQPWVRTKPSIVLAAAVKTPPFPPPRPIEPTSAPTLVRTSQAVDSLASPAYREPETATRRLDDVFGQFPQAKQP